MLTPKQQLVYDLIRDYIRKHGQSPTLDELQESLRLKNKHSVVQFLDYLDAKWYIEKGRGYRSIRLADRIIASQLTIHIPILGFANAGKPLAYADESALGTLEISKNIVTGDTKRYFFVRVSGTSMNQFVVKWKKMTNGSYALVDSSIHFASGDTWAFLCVVNECATLKKIKPEGEYIYLLPESDDSSHKPIILSSDDKLEINGKIVDVFNFD
jgi:SOS-response transcriptional repressor LexA